MPAYRGMLAGMTPYGFAIFIGAFLLFQVQPLIAKFLLPWFGGAPGVWTTCMLFFQVLLLGGYAYAHWSSRTLKLRTQVVVHLALIMAAIATLPITPAASWKPQATADPTLRIIILLSVTLGLPYFVLSGTAPLLQHWFSRAHLGVSPFRLYALSNAGSLLALLSFPILFETWFTRTQQAEFWSAGLALYAISCGWCGLRLWNVSFPEQTGHSVAADAGASPSRAQTTLWLLLPACASVLLLAITNKICQDVAVIAFLWVLPLTVYLLSFIICFEKPSWYRRTGFGVALAVALGAMGWCLAGRAPWSAPIQIGIYAIGLFICCMVCHGEVYRLKPAAAHLTSFYLRISAGGALGGVFVAVVAPAVFSDYFELHWGLLGCGVLFLVIWAQARGPGHPDRRQVAAWGLACLALVGLAIALWRDAHEFAAVRASRSRNFYGVLNVFRYKYPDPTQDQVELMHGRVTHGMQYLHPSRVGWPTLYFSPSSGIGRTFAALPPGNRRLGVVGLGAGTLAAYGQRGDQLRFYEINPVVETVARTYFSYLQNSAATVTVALGDARLSMEQEAPQGFDLLVLDAFSSDAIPLHLLTREAFEVYRRHLKTNGVIAVHVSNASLNLEPVVANLAQHFGYEMAVIEHRETDAQRGGLPSTWVVLSHHADFIRPLRSVARPQAPTVFAVPLWTDDFSGLFQVVRWRELFGSGPKKANYAKASTVFKKREDVAAAITRYREDLARDTNSAVVLNNLACLLATAADATLRNGTEAVDLAKRACGITDYRNTVILTTLAAAYAEAGRFDDAVATGEKACALAAEKGEEALLQRNRQLLELYRRKEAYHQAAP